jgi:hypothetical protein
MNKTLTVSIAGVAAMDPTEWLNWERVVGDLASQCDLKLTHSAVRRTGARPQTKMKIFRPLRSHLAGTVIRYSLASVPASFITITQDALLYANRSAEGLYVTVAVGVLPAAPELFVESSYRELSRCVARVQGKAAFLLGRTELAVNYASGANDIRDCKKAKVLFYRPGGFLPR